MVETIKRSTKKKKKKLQREVRTWGTVKVICAAHHGLLA